MNHLALPSFLLLLAAAAPAQTCFYTVNADPYGTVPHGAIGSFLLTLPTPQPLYTRHHLLIPAGVFQNVPARITDIAVGARNGWRTYYSRELTIRMGHTTVGTLTSTFAQNITSPLQDVLVAHQHVWTEGPGPAWIPLGLQAAFQFLPGNGDLLIEIVQRETTLLETVAYNDLGTANVGTRMSGSDVVFPTQANSQGSAPRLQFCVDRAETLLHGQSCAGSGGSTPLLGVTGRPTPGSTPTLWLSDAPANAIAACAYGFDTRPPFPVDLTPLGAPGCRQYFGVAFADVVLANNLGIGQRTILVPSAAATIGAILYAQYFVLDPPANALDVTASNYARLLVGL
jgi:hypothetical protein